MSLFIETREKAEYCRFGRFIAKLDVMFRGITQASFSSEEVALIEVTFAELAICHSEPLFVADYSVMIERLLE